MSLALSTCTRCDYPHHPTAPGPCLRCQPVLFFGSPKKEEQARKLRALLLLRLQGVNTRGEWLH